MDFENIFKSRKIILKMLKIRGYDTIKYENQNREELMILFQNRDKKITTTYDTIDILCEGENNKIFVKYILTDKTRSKAIEKYIDNYYYEENFLEKEDDCIFITKDKVTYKGTLENYINNLYYTDKIFCQVMWLNSLLYDITLNKLVPEYEILQEEKKLEIMIKYNIDNEKLFPNVLINDPLAVFYGVKEKQLVKATYPSYTNGLTVFYRLCVNSA
jgi:DNA-directed RNA polymerase subunit H (RpoH/RPB5)